ncbi:GyrI-like domain-containing protein [Pseudoflavonifractor phocaeensis]|uniref:GyrI-like domain-containing protein n=1 Tax=Pseudoflavonifractor phocaeensis TaxID=1870988 RepID=UPI002E24E154|nr:GyrI-like domain-containing protein [Pseudoflavonifractor phocaeensis]
MGAVLRPGRPRHTGLHHCRDYHPPQPTSLNKRGGISREKTAGGLRFKTFPEIQAACVFHRGSYRTFSESYETVLRHIEENGYEIAGEIRESYIDGVWNKEDESQWLSEIQVPVRKKRNSSS